MYNEIALIKFLMDKVNFNKYASYIKDINLEQESEQLLKNIEQYYKDYPDKEVITAEELIVYSNLRNPVIKKKDAYLTFFQQLMKENTNSKLIAENFNSILEKYFASEILFKITEALEQDMSGALECCKPVIESFDKIKLKLTNDSKQFITSSMVDIMQRRDEEAGINWRINSLNFHLGPIRGKTLGHVFARVDTGKTSFVLSEEAYWISQCKDNEIVVHFNNEEDGEKLMIRFYCAVLGCTHELLMSKPVAAQKEFYARGGKKFKLYDDAALSIEDIEETFRTYNVKACVIDQADKVHFVGHAKLGDVARLQMVYAKLRELGKKYNVHILTVGQASQSAENKKWLLPTDLDSSKTLKPGEFDYIIGIGRSFDTYNATNEDVRFLHLCKNKLGTGQHAQIEVLFDTTRALYREPVGSELEAAYGHITANTKPDGLAYLERKGT